MGRVASSAENRIATRFDCFGSTPKYSANRLMSGKAIGDITAEGLIRSRSANLANCSKKASSAAMTDFGAANLADGGRLSAPGSFLALPALWVCPCAHVSSWWQADLNWAILQNIAWMSQHS
jgi:hypothetical protein